MNSERIIHHDKFEYLFHCLGYNTFEVRKWQIEFVKLVQDFLFNGKDKGLLNIAIVGANGCGKSAIVAMMLIYYLVYHARYKKPCLGKIISGKYSQLEGSVVSHLERLVQKLHPDVKNEFLFKNREFVLLGHEQNKIEFESWASQHEQTLAGTHEGNIIMCVDEASEPTDNTFTVLKGNLTDCKGILIYTGNPVRSAGEFYDVFESETRTDWHKFQIDYWQGLDGREDNGWAAFIERENGIDSKEYTNRVLGKFWMGGNDRLIPDVYLEMALDPHRPVPRTSLGFVIMVDVATEEGNDETVVGVMDQNVLISWKVHNVDLMTLGKIVVAYMTQYNTGFNHNKVSHVVIDSVGVGYGLKEIIIGLLGWTDVPIIAYKANNKPMNQDRFADINIECAFKMREWLGDRGKIPNTPEFKPLIRDLKAYMTTFENRQRKLGLVSKKFMKKSPDHGDTLIMGFVMDIRQVIMRNYQPRVIMPTYGSLD